MPLARRPNAEIRKIAAELLFKFGHEEDVPVDVDELAEYDLYIKVQTRAGLHAERGVEGAISHDLKIIYLDSRLDHDHIRWRSTVAHELGHAVLHADFIQALPIANDEVLQTALLEVSDADNDILEAEVQVFGDAILVPDASLVRLHGEIIAQLLREDRKIVELSAKSKEALAGNMARSLEVSTRTVEHRLRSLDLEGWSDEDGRYLLPGFQPKS